jgi:serine/threonine-protein kinase RsbW
VNLRLHATPGDVMRAVESLQRFCRERKLGEQEAYGLALALEECGSNIVNHALRRDAQRQFRVAVECSGGAVRIELRDPGPEFDPTRMTDAAEPAGRDDDRPAGGWGIQLVRRHTDEIHYRRDGGENVLLLIKRLPLNADRK